jgi:hypothetical protein
VCSSLPLFAGSIFLVGERGRYVSTQHRRRTPLTTVAGLHAGTTARLAEVGVPRVQHLEEIRGKVTRGDGTAGALLQDPTLDDDLVLLLEGADRRRLVRRGIRHEIEVGRQGGRSGTDDGAAPRARGE